jgi:hypothetical protein
MTRDLISPQELGRLRQALFLGVARQPLAISDPMQALLAATPAREPTLAVLALAGQRQRFQRPAMAHHVEGVPDAARRLHADQRPIVPDRVRRLLLRLANGVDKTFAETAVCSAVRRVTRVGFRVHPFDLPRLIGYIKSDASCLGLAERAYLALGDVATKPEAPSLLHAEVTSENWAEFPKGHRVAFLREERRKDPAGARRLLEGVLKAEPAAARVDLLAALEAGLGVDDLPLLESLTTDRAESVRNLAARLIANVPGTPAYAQRLAEAAQCFARGTSAAGGILGSAGLPRSGAVVLVPPKRATQSERRAALASLLDGFSVAELAAAAALTVDEIAAALPADDDAVTTALFHRAVRDGDEETMARLRLSNADLPGLALSASLHSLALHLSGPVAAHLGRGLLGSAAWRTILDFRKNATTPAAMKDDGTLLWTAAILPPDLLTSFQDAMADLPPVATRSARDFAELILALDALQPPQR